MIQQLRITEHHDTLRPILVNKCKAVSQARARLRSHHLNFKLTDGVTTHVVTPHIIHNITGLIAVNPMKILINNATLLDTSVPNAARRLFKMVQHFFLHEIFHFLGEIVHAFLRGDHCSRDGQTAGSVACQHVHCIIEMNQTGVREEFGITLAP